MLCAVLAAIMGGAGLGASTQRNAFSTLDPIFGISIITYELNTV